MDTLDVLIFCEMSFKYFDYAGTRRHPSPKEIGAKLGVDERTVRARTSRMEREGFIQYYQTIPNLQLFNRPLTCLCNFQSPSLQVKPNILASLRNADSIVDIADFFGESFGVTLSASSETEAQARAEKMAQDSKITNFQLLPARHFPLTEKSPSKLDWQIVKTLRYDAQRPTGSIAKELGITYRMVEHSIRKLFESRTISVRAIINARDPAGLLFYSLNLAVDKERKDETVQALKSAYHKRVWWTINPSGPVLIIFLFATSIGRAEDDLFEALSKKEIQSGSITIFKGWVEPARPSWIDRLIEERIRGHENQISS